ncbi:MAG: Lrp/AsnC family transcriptional regulator [Candidatus Aenigmatarchaeota archaeon]
MAIDELDIKILNILLENSKLSYRKIARKLGVSVTTAMNRIVKMEKEKIIQGYTAKLDYEKLRYDIKVVIDVRVSKGKLFEVESKIAHHPNVSAVFDVTGSFDTMIIANFKSRKEMDRFLKRIQTYDFVERTETKLVLNTIKEGQIVPSL